MNKFFSGLIILILLPLSSYAVSNWSTYVYSSGKQNCSQGTSMPMNSALLFSNGISVVGHSVFSSIISSNRPSLPMQAADYSIPFHGKTASLNINTTDKDGTKVNAKVKFLYQSNNKIEVIYNVNINFFGQNPGYCKGSANFTS